MIQPHEYGGGVETTFPETTQMPQQLGEKAFSLEGFSRVETGELRPLAHVEERLKREIVGQDEAIEALMSALHSDGVRDEDRPRLVVGFFGSTGTGKTKVAEVLADTLKEFVGEDIFTRVNCSEFTENHMTTALVGAPPSYVGRNQQPVFSKQKIEQPYSVVLFDEFEKASPAMRSVALQIFDKGTVKLLNTGEDVSFANTFIILTSNIGGADILKQMRSFGFNQGGAKVDKVGREKIKKTVHNAIERKGGLTPELINRIEKKIVFDQLDDQQLEEVLDQYVEKQNKDNLRKNAIHITLDADLRKEFVESCNEDVEDRRVYNARPVIGKYRSAVESKVGEMLVTGGIKQGSRVYVRLDESVPADASLESRIEVLSKEDPALLDHIARKQTVQQTTANKGVLKLSTLMNNPKAFSAIAAGVLAAGVTSELIGSRRSRRR